MIKKLIENIENHQKRQEVIEAIYNYFEIWTNYSSQIHRNLYKTKKDIKI
jgi:hypothetical protein